MVVLENSEVKCCVTLSLEIIDPEEKRADRGEGNEGEEIYSWIC